jgi:hypothetical protein
MSTQQQTAIRRFGCRNILIPGLTSIISARAANLQNAQELLQLPDVDQKELAGLDQGKKVTFDVAAGKENESAAGVVMYLPNLRLPL